MSRLESVERENWQEFIESPAAVLMLGKSDCEACAAWTKELEAFLADDAEWENVRFGKLLLDRPGLGEFKKQNSWISALTDLPYNIVYVEGERKKEFLGSGVERLVNRMRRVFAAE